MIAAAVGGGVLVAMTIHARTGFAGVVLDSVADEVVRHGGAPMLLVCPTAW